MYTSINILIVLIQSIKENTISQVIFNLIYLDWIKMSQIDDFIKIIKHWKESDKKKISFVLDRLDSKKQYHEDLEEITKVMWEFHKEATKAEQTQILVQWYQRILSIKKKLKKEAEIRSKQKNVPKYEIKKQISSKKQTNKPTSTLLLSLISGRSREQQDKINFLYKNFYKNYQQKQKCIPFVVTFMRNLIRQVYMILQNKSDQQVIKRINSIGLRLGKQSSKQIKDKILEGILSFKDLARNDEELYFDEKTKIKIKSIQDAQVEEGLVGFYADMKKKINSDACQRCPFCQNNKAYCEDMKQIRASDQPMTRFMKCIACDKAWRD